jgi:hypothetical protein
MNPTKFSKEVLNPMEQMVPTTENMPQRVPFQMQPNQNPFNNIQDYGNINLPDIPISNNNHMIDQILGNKDVPDEIKKQFWYVFSNDTTLSFVDSERKQANMLNFDIIKIDILDSIPYYKYTFNMELQLNILRNIYETKLNRAFGFKSGNKPLNERIIMQSQFLEQRNINENNDGINKDGFFRKLLGRR